MNKYIVEVDDEKYTVHANLTQAAAPIIVDGEGGGEVMIALVNNGQASQELYDIVARAQSLRQIDTFSDCRNLARAIKAYGGGIQNIVAAGTLIAKIRDEIKEKLVPGIN